MWILTFLSELIINGPFWLVDQIMQNIIFVFIFSTLAYFILGKKTWADMLIYAGIIWFFTLLQIDFLATINWVILDAGFLSLLFLTRLPLLIFMEDVSSKYVVPAFLIQSIVVLAVYNIFLR